MIDSTFAITAKIESTYGTEPTPTVTTDLIKCSKPTIEVLSESEERNMLLGSYGKNWRYNIGTGRKVTFAIDLENGFKIAATQVIPVFGRLLRSCSFSEVADPTFIAYTFVPSQTSDSCTLWVYEDTRLTKLNGCIGKCKFIGNAGKILRVEFEFTGLYKGNVADVSDTTAANLATQDAASLPFIFQSASVAIGDYAAPILENLEIDLANDVQPRKSANSANGGVNRYFVANSELTVTADPEIVALATYNPFSNWEGTTNNITIAFNCTVGNRKATITAANMQLDSNDPNGERNNISTYALGFSTSGLTSLTIVLEDV